MNKSVYANGLSFLRVGLIVLGALCCLTAQAVQAASCFADARHAYQHLLTQQKHDSQQRKEPVININRAGEGELTTLHGIGSKKAQAIVLYRDMFGRFTRVEDLAKVKGIGTKTVEKNRERLRVHD